MMLYVSLLLFLLMNIQLSCQQLFIMPAYAPVCFHTTIMLKITPPPQQHKGLAKVPHKDAFT